MSRLFGTDGVRGVANKDLTPELAYRLGYAGAVVLASAHTCGANKPKIIIGMDTRISCKMLEAALVSGICSAGANVTLCGVIPTPGIAYLTRKYHFDAGIVISASHNSYEYNGIKFFAGTGFKLPDQIEDEIEAIVQNFDMASETRKQGADVGTCVTMDDAAHLYEEHLKRRMSVDLTDYTICLDCSNGAASVIAPKIFEDLGATNYVIHNHPNGLNINKDCGSTHIEDLCRTVIEKKCDLGLAFDGDADRLLAVDANGNLVDGDAILSIIALDMKKHGELHDDTIVVTVMSNLGMDIMAKEQGLSLKKTKVGDRYVLESMLDGNFNIGGEQSGHVILSDHSTTGDGILTALALLRAITRKKTTLQGAASVISILPQVLLPAHIANENKTIAMEDTDLLAKIAFFEEDLQGKGRVLVRASGTEPMIRVMLEGEDIEQITEMAQELVQMICEKYGSLA